MLLGSPHLEYKAEPMQRTARSSAAVVAAVFLLGLTACGDDDSGGSEADVKAEIAEQLAEDGTLDEETAECFADVIVDEIGADELDGVDFSAEEPPEGLQEEFASAALKAIEDCDLDLGSLEG
jgi:hypothetical protein